MGFNGEISSRTSDGKGWLKKYNDGLANGYSISKCITYATSYYPNSNLGDYAKIYGSSSNTVSSNNKYAINSDLETIKTNIAVSGLANINTTRSKIDTVTDLITNDFMTSNEIDQVLSVIQTMDNEFDINEYKVAINFFAEDSGDGMIILSRCIGDIVQTNEAYIISINNDVRVKSPSIAP